MAATLRALWSRLFARDIAEASAQAVEYSSYRIRPEPYRRNGQYQTCGVIEKEVGGEIKQHRFVRAEVHPGREAAVAFSIAKARQIIDEQGERLFG